MSEVSHPRDYNIATSVERDQVAAAIRDIGRPATAREIGDTITYVAFETCDGSQCRGRMESWGNRIDGHYTDGLDRIGYRGMLSGTARPHLEALVKKGVVTREKVGRSVHWRWVGDAVDMSVIAHLDFETPSEVDLMIEALREAGVEVEYIADPAQGARGGLYSGAIEYRSNGPLSHFRIGLWEQATKSELLSALRSADRLVQGDPQALGKYGKCLGTEVRR